jgi:serine-type D-Ala-D-Ala carboxypeptidase/endopeptidase (penicillin-binding protein 4)
MPAVTRSLSAGSGPRKGNEMKKIRDILLFMLFMSFMSCSIGQQAGRTPARFLAGDSAFANAHLGVSVFDPATGRFIYSYQDDKYFVPASNTKILSCYAGMKYLDSLLEGMRYIQLDTALVLIPTGDPTFLHRDFPRQPVADLIRRAEGKVYMSTGHWKDNALGHGWSWDDYSDYYMAERSAFPAFGNVIRWYQVKGKKDLPAYAADTVDTFIYSEPEIDGKVDFGKAAPGEAFRVVRDRDRNDFTIYEGRERQAETDIPYVTHGVQTALRLVKDSLHKEILPLQVGSGNYPAGNARVIHTQPLDSLLKPMMHISDNFFAEQVLLMAGMKMTGDLSTEKAIDTILKTSLAGFPDKPKWVDGSGLSRYNLITPRDLVWILDRMRKEFSWQRITDIFPTGGKGTLRNYVGESGRLYAKTGTLSGVLALSGYVITRKNNTLIFSVMVNNHTQPNSLLRARIGNFLKYLIDQY